ncbi:hypothetical protein COV20_02135 [Candidatus Woesearchaeota archaeon CG10_big_fil_rev_8_21_14_0_10_45_16]|nr:MAG: hypothetical protein COV20_02135 [Candidatus Woesearchaeota archaeon CG10_big_fil_rev_8_21_14_0_10_45_16]
MDITTLLNFLPSIRGYERNFSLKEGEQAGINPCGDTDEEGYEIYKFLGREGQMVTYYHDGSRLIYVETMKLHD